LILLTLFDFNVHTESPLPTIVSEQAILKKITEKSIKQE